MESLSRCLSASPHFLTLSKTLKSTPISHLPLTLNYTPVCNSTSDSQTPNPPIPRPNFFFNNFHKELSFLTTHKFSLKPQFSFLFLGLSLPSSCYASEITTTFPVEEGSGKINLESILVSIDNFLTTHPFFAITVSFIWFIVIPLTEEYLQKYKFISAVNAFKKLEDEPSSRLLDIRDSKSLGYLPSPNLKIYNKSAVQVEFREGDEDGFVKRVLENVGDPQNTTICVLDNFDGNSMKVAELLVKNGFKEAYAIRGGIIGKNGWQEIQESLLPPSLHIYPKERTTRTKQLDVNGGTRQVSGNSDNLSSSTDSTAKESSKEVDTGDLSSTRPTIESKSGSRPSSPYPNYPDYKPPSSPTPSKPI